MYEKTLWKNQSVEKPRTYDFSQNQDGTYKVFDAFGEIEELGTPVNAMNMNHIEEGIYQNSIDIENHEERISAIETKEDDDIDINLINNSKAFETGELSDREDIFNSCSSYWVVLPCVNAHKQST